MESIETQKIDEFINTREDGTREYYKLITTNVLTKKQTDDVNQVVDECLKYDNLERTLYLSNDLNYFINLHCFYLLYKNNQLVSVLTIFQPLESEAELSAYTLPKERQKGYFSYLLDLAEEELVEFHIVRILFVVEPGSKDGIRTIEAIDAKYKMSEYLLCYDLCKVINIESINQIGNINDPNEENDPEIYHNGITLQEMNDETLTQGITLSSNIFNLEFDETKPLLTNTINSKTVKSYLAFLNQDLIGICNVNFGITSASIYGLGIDPIYRGKGYGKSLLQLIINKIIQETKHVKQDISIVQDSNKEQDSTIPMNDIYHKINYITLEVGSENHIAYSMYINSGFEIKTQYDYYKYIIELDDGFDV